MKTQRANIFAPYQKKVSACKRSEAYVKSRDPQNSSRQLLCRCRLLAFDCQETLLILAELFSQSPSRLQHEIQAHCPRPGIRLRVLDRDVIPHMIMIHAPDSLDNMQSVAMRVTHAVEPGLVIE